MLLNQHYATFLPESSSLVKVSLMCECEPGESFLLHSLSVCSLWLWWLGSISWEKNWLRVTNCHNQLQVKSEAELRSVRNTLKLLTTRVYLQDSAGNFETWRILNSLVDLLQLKLFWFRKQRIMGNISVQWVGHIMCHRSKHRAKQSQ